MSALFNKYVLRRVLCPICNSLSLLMFEHLDISKKKVELFKCVNCGHGFYPNTFSEQSIKAIYENDYATEYLDDSVPHSLRKIQYKEDVSTLIALLEKSSINVNGNLSIIDIGCSSGEYLESMPKFWSKFGFEVNPAIIQILKNKKNEFIFYDNLETVSEKFDIITMRGVIEHLTDYEVLLRFFANNLKKDGFLFISATPDFNSPCAVIYKENWSQVVAPEHINQFTAASLQILLAKANLVLKSLIYPYFEGPYQNWDLDKKLFLTNLGKQTKCVSKEELRHPFPGNMMTALFQKVIFEN